MGFARLLFLSCLPVSASSLLIKHKETFKFSDLYYLHAQILDPTCRRILVDAATGSNLLEGSVLDDTIGIVDWKGHVRYEASDAASLVAAIDLQMDRSWTLDYVRLSEDRKLSVSYSSKALMCAVSQKIGGASAALCLDAAEARLLLVETGPTMYLVELLEEAPRERVEWQDAWSKRPFLYSSAIHPTVADVVIDLLIALCGTNEIHLHDPTCGSGTFLAAAKARNVTAMTGWEMNPSVAEGCRTNLEGCENIHVQHRDSTLSRSEKDLFDCMVCNLPWGENTVDYRNQNRDILASVRPSLRRGSPCVVITRDALHEIDGYTQIGSASIPQAGFQLPGCEDRIQKGKCMVSLLRCL